MSLVKTSRVAAVVFAWAVLAAVPAGAATFQSIGTGNWNSGGTWNQAGATPTSADDVQIMDGHTVTVTSTADVANSVTFVPSSFTTTLQINAGAKLQVTGNVTIADGGFANATFNVGDGTLVVGGNITIQEGVNGGVGRLIIGSGSASCNNLLITTGAAADTRIEFTNAGLLSMKGSMSSAGTLVNFTSGAGSTVKFDGAASQTIGNYTYQNLQIANTSVNPVEAAGAFTVNGTLAINTGIFLVKNSFTAGPSAILTMAGSTYLKLGDATTTFNVSLADFASYTLGTGTTIHYGANANQTISFDPVYQNLDVAFTGSVGSPVKQFVSNMVILGNLNVDQQAPGSVTLDVGAGLVTVGGTLMGDGGIAFPSGGTLALAGDFNNTGTFSAGTGTFKYDGGQFQNARNAAYNNLIVTGTNTNASVGTTGGSAATLTVDANAFFDLNNNFTVSGAVVVDGTVNSTGETLNLGASAATISGSGAIYAHVSSGTRSIATGSSLDFNGNFTITSGATVTNQGTTTILNSLAGTDGTSQWINAANSTLYVGGFVMTTGLLDASANPNAVYYNGGNQTIKAGTYHDLVLTSTIPAAKTLPGVTINHDFVVFGSSTATATGSVDVNNDVTIVSPAVFDAGAFTHTIAGEWTIGGTFTPSNSTITFDGTAQSLTASPFYNVSFPTGTKTLGGNLDVANDFGIGSTATVSAGSTTINVAGDWMQASGGTFTSGTSSVVFDGTTAQSIDATTFHTLVINKATGQVSLSGNVSAAQLDLFGGDLLVGSNTLDVNGDVTLNGGTFDLGTGTTTVAGDLATNSTMTATTAWLIIDGAAGIQNWTGTTSPTLHNLEINKPSASLNPALDLNVSGFLQLTSGDIVTTGAVNVTSGQIIHTSGYVDGRLNVTHTTNGAKLYPLGTTNGYSPVVVTIANPGQLDVEVFNAPQPNNTNANAELLQIYWTIHPTTVSGSVDLTFEWPAGVVNGTESAYILGRYSGGSWTQPASSVNDVTHTGTATGVSAFTGDWTAGGPAAVGAISDLEISSDGNAVAGVGETITITAKNAVNATVTSYSGFHTLVFSGPSTSPGGNVPTILDKDLNAQDVGNNTVLNFVNGVATTTATFYATEFASIDATEGALTGSTHGVNVDAAAASKLAFTSINGGNPLYATVPFSLTVSAQDAYGNASAVVANTQVDVTCGTCTGNLAGTLTQTIPSGTDSVGFPGLTYDTPEAGVVFNAAATAGDALTGASTAALTFNSQAAGYTVTTNADSGAGSLRDAIAAANSGACGTPCNITFDILPAGMYTIALATRLPPITQPVVIDGETQDGYAGSPLLILDNAGNAGFELAGGNSTVRGFVIKNFSGGTGIILNSDANVVQNCWIGVNETGLTASGNSIGIEVYGNNNLIGGSVATARNIISGNTAIGLSIGSTGSGNTASGNYIGVDKNGSAAIANALGVLIGDTATGTTIGGATVAHRNVIAGNSGDGIQIQGAAGDVTNTAIKNNHIGVAADGTTTLGNTTGIHLLADVDGIFIGQAGEGNVIGGNDFAIGLDAVTVQNVSIIGNRIGVAADGTTNIGNVNGAIVINGSSGTVVEQNVIANNGGAGVNVLAGDANTILDNTIRAFGSQAIDLGGDGADTIDPTDPDLGPNGHQNAPAIASAVVNGSNLDVTLSVDSSATSAVSLFLEVYESDATGALGTLLGTTCFANDVLSNAIMSVPLGAVTAGDKVVATATSYTDMGCGSVGDGTSEASVTATVTCAPVAVTITGATSMCAGGSVTLDAGAGYAGYLWSNGAITQTITVSPGTTTPYSVTVTAANGCTGTDSHTVTVNPNPTVTITGPATACDSAVLDAGSGHTSYLWSTGATTQTITVTTGGTYTVTVQNGSGCSASDTHAITINPSPTPTITGPGTACDSAVLNAGAGWTSYLWSNGDTTQTTTVTATGTYSVTVTDGNGCSGSDSHAVTITTTPGNTITPSGPTTFCTGGSVTLTASPAASYLWSTGATTSSIVVTTAGSYSVQTTNGTCTATSAPVAVTVNPNPTPVIIGPSTACDSAVLDAGPGYTSYLWSNGDTTQTTTVTATGTYTVTVTDGNTCSGSDSHAVTISTTPGNAVTPSGPTTFCAGGSVTLTASPAASYLWSTGATTSSIVVTTGGSYSVQTTNGTCTATSAPVAVTVNPSPTVVITGPSTACDSAVLDAGPGYTSYLWSNGDTTQTTTVTATGTYSVTVTDGNTCSGSVSHAVTISTTPGNAVTPSGPTTFCAGGSVTLTASPAASYLWSTGATTSSIVVTTAGSYSVQTTNGTCTATSAPVTVTVNPNPTPVISGPASACDSAVLDAGPGFANYLWSTGATTQTITVTTGGTYSVTVTGAGGCSGSDSHAISISNSLTPVITGPTTACAPSTVTLDAGTGFSSYLWSTGATTQTITVSATGTYSVTVTGAGGCTGSDSHNVTIFPAATATISASGPTTFCTGGSVVLSANAGSSYLWSTGETTQSITVTASGSYSVTVTDGNACSATSAPATVTVSPAPSVTIIGPAATCIASPVTLDAGPGFASYLWSTGATAQTITVSPVADTTYSVTVSSGAGCTASDSHTVTVDANPAPTLTVPAGVCSNSTGNAASVPFQAGATYLWTVGNGTITGGQGTSAITFTAGASGNVTVGITMTSGTCTSTGTENVPISPVPSSTITAPATLEASSTGNAASVPSTAGATYSWGIVNGTITGGFGTNAITFTAGASGTTKLTITVDVNGCSSSNLKNISINGAAPSGADLVITKSAPSSALVSSALKYTIVVTNNGPQSVSDVVINDPLPHGTTFVSVDGGSFGCGHSAGVVLCNGALPAGVSITIAINVTTPSTAGLIVNNATIESSSSDDADPSNNGASAATNVFSNGGNCPTAVPQLTAPSAGSTAASPVNFSWTPVPQAVGYRLWFEANGTAPQEAGKTDGAIMLTANVPPGVIVAYVDALFNGCPERRSPSITFNVNPPDACGPRATPVPLAPANGATINTSRITFQWTAASGADGYRVWVAVNGGTPAVLGTTTDETSLTGNAGPGTITWWVEALYEGCASTESQHLTFTVPAKTDCATQSPVALSPANGTTVNDGNVTFQWSGVPNALEYEVWLSVANGTHTLIGVTDGTSLQAVVAEGTLDWFVRAIIDRCPARDSQHARFAHDAPDACDANQRPTLIAPLPNQAVTSPADFSWTNVGASSYQLFLIRGNAPPQLVATTTTPFRNGVELNGGRMRWFVRALFGNCSPLDSADQKLEVVPEPQACAPLVPPVVAAAGQISSGVPFLVQWNEVPGATSYQVQIASNAAFSDAELVTTDKHQHQLTRTNGGNAPLAVFVRVRATDARCTPEATVTPFGPAAVIFILPVGGTEGSAPVDGGIVTHTLNLGPELAGQTFTASVKEPWLTVAPASGVVAAGGTNLTVTAHVASLPLGTTLGAVRIELSTPASINSGSGNVASHATTLTIPTVSITKVTPVLPTPKSGPPPDALIIPAVAHADGVNSKFQSDVRVTNSSAQLINYQLTFTPSGGAGITTGRQTTFSIDPGHTIALDDILKSWFGTGGESVTGTLEVRPLTQTASSTSSAALSGLPNLSTFASSRTFNKTLNGTFGQYIPAIPFANFIDRNKVLSLQQIAQSDRYRTNLGIVEGSGSPANLLVKVFGSSGQKLTEFPVQLAGGQHTQLNSFLLAQGVGNLTDGRIEISLTSGAGKVTAYASVLDNQTSDPLLVTPVTLGDAGATKWVVPGVADLDNGTANWQTDMRVFNAGATDVEATLLFYSQNGGEPRRVTVPIAAGQVRQFDRTLANTFGATSDGGAVHITTAAAAKLITTARTYNLTSTGTYGQFISGVTTAEAAGVGSRPLQLLQIEESNRFRTNVGLAEVTGNPVKLEIAIVPPDAKFTAFTEVHLGPNEFRQLNSVLRSAGFADTYNVRVTVRAVDGNGRVTAYASVIDMLTNDPTYVPAQ